MKENTMIRNYFYLIVGIMCLLSAITHTLNGSETTLAALTHSTIDSHSKVVFTYVWHIIGAESIVFGITLLIMAFCKDTAGRKYIAWFIIAMLIVRWLTIIIFSSPTNFEDIAKLIPETIAIWVIILLLWLGTKKRHK